MAHNLSSQAGADGAASGSSWACRETFVAIIVTNLLIIYPLIRQGAKKIGLSVLFSKATTRGDSRGYPLDSGARQKSRTLGSRGLGSHADHKWKGGSHNLHTITRVTGQARESDEDIILDNKNSPTGGGLHNIVVSREFTVETEASHGPKVSRFDP